MKTRRRRIFSKLFSGFQGGIFCFVKLELFAVNLDISCKKRIMSDLQMAFNNFVGSAKCQFHLNLLWKLRNMTNSSADNLQFSTL
jgi:hypothetical protein